MTQGVIAIICGLRSEARAVRAAVGSSPSVRVGVSGADAARAGAIAAEFAAAGAMALFSVGLSGGLDPALRPGDVICGTDILTVTGERIEARPAAVVTPPGARRGMLLGSDAVIASAAQKASLFDATGALAVDMESHSVARAAAAAAVPFAAIRAVADPFDRALPPAALGAVAPDGSTRVLRTLAACALAPAQLPALIQLGADARAATAALTAAARIAFAEEAMASILR